MQEKQQRRQITRIPINQDYFKIWSNNMAYIFGLWCACGLIYKKEGVNQFSINLKLSDKYLLQLVLDEMGSKHQIYNYQHGNNRFMIGSRTIVEDIIKLGGVQNKSKTLTFPNIPKKYLSYFIHGYIDGNGSYYWKSQQKQQNKIPCISISGTKEFFKKMDKHISNITNTKETNVKVYDYESPKIQYGSIKSKLIVEWLMKNDCLCLVRKKEIALDFLKWEPRNHGNKINRVMKIEGEYVPSWL
jgi:hypothetical protein